MLERNVRNISLNKNLQQQKNICIYVGEDKGTY